MEIIPLITKFTNTFNEIFKNNFDFFNLESKIKTVGDTFTLKLYEEFLNYLDISYKNSKERKETYNVKQTRPKTLITSLGCITVNSTAYINKETKERYVPLRDILYLKPYQRLTNEAEYQLVKYSMEENMSQAAKHALRNVQVSRSCVSKKIRVLDGSIIENVSKTTTQPDSLFMEMDEIHANLQHGGNKICPCAIIHEGYEENFTKRKKLKNIKYFASSDLKYEELWEVMFDYADKRYDISKFKKIFISGDGAPGIKKFTNCFPNAIFVLDKFHYQRKYLNYIFKDNVELKKIADSYIRNDLIDDFKTLVKYQIDKYPEQEKEMIKHQDYILNNIEGIKNQDNVDYKVSCSMEGHVNQAFARYITSSPYGFSLRGLENKLKLLVYHANKHELTIEDYFKLKYGENDYKVINENINKIVNLKYDQKLSSNHSLDYNINTPLPIFDSPSENNKLNEILSPRGIKYV